MATTRRSDAITATITIPAGFSWSNEGTLTQVRGGSAVTRTINWDQGNPEVANFDATDDITLKFWTDNTLGTEITSSDSGWTHGDHNLGEIVTLTNFVDDNDGTGSVDISLNTNILDDNDVTSELHIYASVEVSQPDPGD